MSEELQPKRRPGRPAKGKRGNFTFRVTSELREKLQNVSNASDLSISEEIERRLEKSFNDQSVVADMLGGPHTARLMMTMAVAIQLVEAEMGNRWCDDHDTNSAMKSAVQAVLGLVETPDDEDLESRGKRGGLWTGLVGTYTIGQDAAQSAMRIAKASSKKKIDPTEPSKSE